jgi:hypothetical protein
MGLDPRAEMGKDNGKSQRQQPPPPPINSQHPTSHKPGTNNNQQSAFDNRHSTTNNKQLQYHQDTHPAKKINTRQQMMVIRKCEYSSILTEIRKKRAAINSFAKILQKSLYSFCFG